MSTRKRRLIDPDRDEVPADMDEFRLAIARKIMSMLGAWRDCDLRPCRRAHRCNGRDVPCLHKMEPITQSADEQSHMLASLRRAIARRLAEIDAAEEDAKEDAKEKCAAREQSKSSSLPACGRDITRAGRR